MSVNAGNRIVDMTAFQGSDKMSGKKMKVYNGNEFTKILLKNGFKFVSAKGSHKKYKRGNQTVVINQKINRMIAQRLIKENNLVLS